VRELLRHLQLVADSNPTPRTYYGKLLLLDEWMENNFLIFFLRIKVLPSFNDLVSSFVWDGVGRRLDGGILQHLESHKGN
jgi:hypothetical protein